jgi:carbamoyl-phosphate synthase large subunit
MPRRTDLHSILIIGAGPIVIGQACEFDYSGAQACKALREEGYRVILVNSNPATIMTDPGMADATYIEPITWQVVEKIIEKERPDALLPTMGGQTALNCALDLARHGVLEKYGVEMIGASKEAIDKAEDREKFKAAMTRLGLGSARSSIAHSMEEALQVQAALGFPAIIRPSFTMGGSGGGIAYNKDEFVAICERGLEASPTHELLIEESLLGWKEYEMEVVRDRKDNCIIICSIENFDPMGVHTGDSITVAPAQTLTDKEYQIMRNASLAVLREIGVDTGGSNVQFAINPADGRMVVIEMNPRVSRSSALASKATGFPIAKVAAKLAIGYTLDELQNEITGGATPASFEPSIDYVVTKVPRFAFEKFPQADDRLTTQMKSVGEVMAMGRTFQESLQKALRGLEVGADGLDPHTSDDDEIEAELMSPGPERIWYVGDAFRVGMSLEEVHAISKIDPWFLDQILGLIEMERDLAGRLLEHVTAEQMRQLKRAGFSDRRLATLLNTNQHAVRARRNELDIHPVYKRVDTCAAEFATQTAYMYSTYEEECESRPSGAKKIMVLGGGPNRIGQGIEFDYCCVHAALALRENGFETIMVNCNPETVSTDYDTSDRLYFEPLTLEDVLEIVRIEKPWGVIVQYGGQTPLKLARDLEANGVPIIGTSPDMIDAAEDRERFQKMLHELGLKQPPNRTARDPDSAIRMAEEIGYPLVVRPSYVLGGRAMEIVREEADLRRYMTEAVKVSNDSPVLLDRFLNDAIEVDVDALSDGEQVVIGGIMQHIEQAGVHSGDSACSLPPYSLSDAGAGRVAPADRVDGEGPQGDRPDERAVRDPGRHRLRARSQPARLAHRALRFQGHRRAAGENRRAGDGRHHPAVAGFREGNRPALLFGQGSGVPVRQVPRRRHHPRSRDEVHRRGHGSRHDLRRSLRQVAAGGELGPAEAGRAGLRQRAFRRPRGGGRTRPGAARSRLQPGRHARYCAGDRGRRHSRGSRQQGQGRPPAHRRHDQERRRRPDRQRRRGQKGGEGFLCHSRRGAGAPGRLFHHPGRGARCLHGHAARCRDGGLFPAVAA